MSQPVIADAAIRELVESAKIQGRVLYAMVLREARTRYGRRRAGYLWGLIEPLIHISFFYIIYKYWRQNHVPLGDSLFVFFASGLTVFIGWRNVFTRVMGAYGSNAALLSFPSVTLMDAYISRGFLELMTWTTVLVLIFTGIVVWGSPFPNNIIYMVSAVLSLFFLAFGLGVCLGLLIEFVPASGSFIRVPRRILYWISGCFFLPDSLPSAFQAVLSWNPIIHGITLFRVGYYYGYESQFLDTMYLYKCAVGFALAAFIAEKMARRRIRNLV